MVERIVVGVDANNNPRTVGVPPQTGDCVIVHLLDENSNPVVLAAPMAKLYHFAMFRDETEMHLDDVPLEVFCAFVDFLYVKDAPYELDIFKHTDLAWVIPELASFLHNKLTHKEFSDKHVTALYDLLVEEATAPPPKDLIVFYNDSLFFNVAVSAEVY